MWLAVELELCLTIPIVIISWTFLNSKLNSLSITSVHRITMLVNVCRELGRISSRFCILCSFVWREMYILHWLGILQLLAVSVYGKMLCWEIAGAITWPLLIQNLTVCDKWTLQECYQCIESGKAVASFNIFNIPLLQMLPKSVLFCRVKWSKGCKRVSRPVIFAIGSKIGNKIAINCTKARLILQV